MSEDLLKAILQLFVIVVQNRASDVERNKIRDFLLLHVNRNSLKHYLGLFDRYRVEYEENEVDSDGSVSHRTMHFVSDWSKIILISKRINYSLTLRQKTILIVKIIELIYSDGLLTDREENLIFYMSKILKVPTKEFSHIKKFVFNNKVEDLSSQAILIIGQEQALDKSIRKGPFIKSPNLEGFIAILRLQEVGIFFIKYIGTTPLTINVLPLIPGKIDVFSPGSAIHGTKIDTIYYSETLRKFLSEENTEQLSFVSDHIFHQFYSGKVVLQNINIAEKGAKLIAIMGASGSGKSTLFNILNGSEAPSSGRVLINDIDIHRTAKNVEGVIGFVPQDDLLNEDLTVFKNLYYAARLCCGDKTEEEIISLVTRVLNSLDLTKIQHLKVGNSLEKIISGGQRKRLNIGLELLREPSILFVDEPTSGLSSRDSGNIMNLLKDLTLRGKMIFIIIHQPSSDIFKMFDKLVILDAGGFQIYYGPPVDAITYFQDIINSANKSRGACLECGNVNPEQIFEIIEAPVVNEYGNVTNERKISPGEWYQYFKQKIGVLKISPVKVLPHRSFTLPSPLSQWRSFLQRDFFSKSSNRQYVIINFLLSPTLALFISFFLKYYDYLASKTFYTFYGNDNIPAYFFMSIIVSLFVGLVISSEEIYRDRKILKREKFLHLSRTSYLLSKITILFAISAIQTLCFCLVGNLILEIPLTEIRFWFILFACSCLSCVMGLNISSAFSSAVTIYMLIPLLVIPQLLLAGVVIRFDKFNPAISNPKGIPTVGEFVAARWAFEACMVSQFKDNPYQREFHDYDQKIAIADYKQIYYLPTLESTLSAILTQRKKWQNTPGESGPLPALCSLLQTEINKELLTVGPNKFPEVNQLVFGKFDSITYVKTKHFLTILKRYYANIRANNMEAKKEKILSITGGTSEGQKKLKSLRNKYQNEAIATLVENKEDVNRIVLWNGELIPKIYPIYNNQLYPKHLFDFKAPFFAPQKHFMGMYFDTFYFNIIVIWCMTIILYATLHFEILKKIVSSIEKYNRYRREILRRIF